ncbi:pallilysin-related adhesin [Spirochaetia bacterium 38H-sp]|uniref:Pallilysin-related adhesin n=1 Tax=Rarispira pelagica TaxID=3141764 RepID=A0ABU9UDV8_9SPIR
MRRFVFLLVFLYLLSSCSGKSSYYGFPAKGPIIEYSTGIEASSEQNTGRLDNIESNLSPYISIPDDYVIVDIIQTNLDIDGDEEQVIAYKKKNDAASRIELAVVDYDSLREVYRRAWSTVLEAVNPHFFSVTPMDITGNHINELIVEGIDARGEQVFTIYQRELSPWGISLIYSTIFDIRTKGKVEILHKNRSAAYSRGQADGEAFDLQVTQELSDNSEKNIITTTVYKWNPLNRTYEKAGYTEENKKIESDDLKKLFEGTANDIETFLSGPWFKESGSKRLFVDFDLQNREITFFSTDIQEAYIWKSSVKNIYSGLGINARSKILANLSQYFYVTITDENTIKISASNLQTQDTFSWSGTYSRLTYGLQKSLLKYEYIPILGASYLSGRFYNETSGGEIIFYTPNRIKIISPDKNIEGYYTIYKIKDHTILEIRIKDTQKRLYYSLLYTETNTDIGKKKEITLTPVTLKAREITPIPGELSTTLQQLETKKQ